MFRPLSSYYKNKQFIFPPSLTISGLFLSQHYFWTSERPIRYTKLWHAQLFICALCPRIWVENDIWILMRWSKRSVFSWKLLSLRTVLYVLYSYDQNIVRHTTNKLKKWIFTFIYMIEQIGIATTNFLAIRHMIQLEIIICRLTTRLNLQV